MMKKIVLSMVCFFACAFLFSGCEKKNGLSIENRDYVFSLEVEKKAASDEYVLSFSIIDLTDYSGDKGKSMAEKKYVCQTDMLYKAIDKYYEDNGRALDLGHLSSIKLADNTSVANCSSLFIQISDMPGVAKSVMVDTKEGEINLRELIKLAYGGEK